MKIRHKINGGLAEVGDDYGKILVDSGAWEVLDGPKPRVPGQPPKPAKKVAQKAVQTEK